MSGVLVEREHDPGVPVVLADANFLERAGTARARQAEKESSEAEAGRSNAIRSMKSCRERYPPGGTATSSSHATGTITTPLRRMSEIDYWVPVKLFHESVEYTVQPRR